MADPLTNGSLERLRQLERRMDAVEQVPVALARVEERIDGVVRTLGRIEREIREDREDREMEQQEQRKASLGEKTVIFGAGGVVIAAVIQAIAQLAGSS